MNVKTRKSIAAVILAILLTVQPVAAWSACGHHIIAVLPFDLMNPSEQQRVIELLQKHPRYVDDFEPLRSDKNHIDFAHWTLGRAGYWPEVARDQPLFNRPNWHYQLGSTLTIGAAVNVHCGRRSWPEFRFGDLLVAGSVRSCLGTGAAGLRQDPLHDVRQHGEETPANTVSGEVCTAILTNPQPCYSLRGCVRRKSF